MSRRSRVRAIAGGVLLGALAPVAAPAVAAPWTDAVPVAGTTLTAATVRIPTDFACQGLATSGLTFTWTAVPGAVSYTVRWTGGGQATVTAPTYTTGALLALGSATVEANFGAWGSSGVSASKGYLILLGGVAVCG